MDGAEIEREKERFGIVFGENRTSDMESVRSTRVSTERMA
jgi:hypothetical protein